MKYLLLILFSAGTFCADFNNSAENQAVDQYFQYIISKYPGFNNITNKERVYSDVSAILRKLNKKYDLSFKEIIDNFIELYENYIPHRLPELKNFRNENPKIHNIVKSEMRDFKFIADSDDNFYNSSKFFKNLIKLLFAPLNSVKKYRNYNRLKIGNNKTKITDAFPIRQGVYCFNNMRPICTGGIFDCVGIYIVGDLYHLLMHFDLFGNASTYMPELIRLFETKNDNSNLKVYLVTTEYSLHLLEIVDNLLLNNINNIEILVTTKMWRFFDQWQKDSVYFGDPDENEPINMTCENGLISFGNTFNTWVSRAKNYQLKNLEASHFKKIGKSYSKNSESEIIISGYHEFEYYDKLFYGSILQCEKDNTIEESDFIDIDIVDSDMYSSNSEESQIDSNDNNQSSKSKIEYDSNYYYIDSYNSDDNL